MTIIPRTPLTADAQDNPMEVVQHLYGELACALDLIPQGRLTALAKTRLEESYFWTLTQGAQPTC